MGEIDQKTLSMSLRFDLILTPELSIQFWGQPFIASGDYSDFNESGSGLNYEFGNPEFNIKEFLSNLVFRWEYKPGSFLYLVWLQSRSGSDSTVS